MGGTYSIIKKWIEGNCMDDIDFIIDLITTHTKAINNKTSQIHVRFYYLYNL